MGSAVIASPSHTPERNTLFRNTYLLKARSLGLANINICLEASCHMVIAFLTSHWLCPGAVITLITRPF